MAALATATTLIGNAVAPFTMPLLLDVLGIDGALAFQPLRPIDRPAARSWAAEWIAGLLAHEKVLVTPEVKESVWSALGNLATAPAPERTMTGLSVLLQSNALKSALAPYTLEGPFGQLLDAAEDRLALSVAVLALSATRAPAALAASMFALVLVAVVVSTHL